MVTEPARLVLTLQTATHRFHRDLPPWGVWTYDGSLPGPTIEVTRGVAVEVLWENYLSGPLPVVVTAALSGFSVIHLHGGMTLADSDGWAENMAAPGQPTLDTYPNDQRATMLWYHDHVMGVTRFSVYAGLAGLWIVRDERERELELPWGAPYELPLLLTDRNFDANEDGSLTGDLLHKTDPKVMECFGPSPPSTARYGRTSRSSRPRTASVW